MKEFLANSAAEHGLTFHSEPINLNDAASRAGQDYQEAARRKSLELEVVLPPVPVMVQGDRTALGQVLDNLLSNAVKFSPSGKKIVILVQSLEHGAECVVQDQGPGFSDEDKQRMFRRYGRLSARPTGGEPSTGLGLSIVKKLVQHMGGELSCESAPGGGAAFRVQLPRASNPN